MFRFKKSKAVHEAFRQALDRCDAVALKAALQKGADPNSKFHNDRTPLHVAARRGEMDICQVLLEHGAELDARDRYGKTAFHVAIESGEPVLAEMLLAQGASTGADNKKNTPIMLAVQSSCLSLLRVLAAKPGADINALNEDNETALSISVQKKNLAAFNWLLEQPGLLVDVPDRKLNRPLYHAVSNSEMTMAAALILRGADMNAVNDAGETPLMRAAAEGSIRLVDLLITESARRNQPLTLDGALHRACLNDMSGRIVEMLLNAGAEIDSADNKGLTPLMYAAVHGNIAAVEQLLARGARQDLRNGDGNTVYQLMMNARMDQEKKKQLRHLLRDSAPPAPAKDGETAPAPAGLPLPALARDAAFSLVNKHSVAVDEGGGLTMTFNFWTRQVIIRDMSRDTPMVVQSFADIPRQESLLEAHEKLVQLGGEAPAPESFTLDKTRAVPRPAALREER